MNRRVGDDNSIPSFHIQTLILSLFCHNKALLTGHLIISRIVRRKSYHRWIYKISRNLWSITIVAHLFVVVYII